MKLFFTSILFLSFVACNNPTNSSTDTSSDNAQVKLFAIGGFVSGLSGTDLILNNGSEDLSINANSSFVFNNLVANGSTYNVTVKSQPVTPNQTCSISKGSGTISGNDVSDVSVVCSVNTYTVGGSVTGLNGAGLVLSNNGSDDLTINADGSFTFTSFLADGASYSVTVKGQPGSQICTVSNGSTGTISGANISDVVVTCTNLKFSGATCTSNVECLTTHCSQGYCCNTVCNSICMSCGGLPNGPAGSCTNVPIGSDPLLQCSGKFCNGNGACNP